MVRVLPARIARPIRGPRAQRNLPVAEDVDALTETCRLHRICDQNESVWPEMVPGQSDGRRVGVNPVDDHTTGAIGEKCGADETGERW